MQQKTTSNPNISLGLTDAAIVFRETGVEVIVPGSDLDSPVGKHLYPFYAIAAKLNDKEFVEGLWKQFTAKMQEHHENSSGTKSIDLQE